MVIFETNMPTNANIISKIPTLNTSAHAYKKEYKNGLTFPTIIAFPSTKNTTIKIKYFKNKTPFYNKKGVPNFNKHKEIEIKLDKDSILIIEGLHSLNDDITKSIPKENKYKIYISPLTGINIDNHNRLRTTDNRLLRRMVRDNLTRGYTASQTLESWSRVRSGETKYVFPYQDSADVVLNTSLIYEISVLKVYAEPLLYSVSEDDINYDAAIRLINILRMILPMPSSSIPLDSVLREFIGNSCFE